MSSKIFLPPQQTSKNTQKTSLNLSNSGPAQENGISKEFSLSFARSSFTGIWAFCFQRLKGFQIFENLYPRSEIELGVNYYVLRKSIGNCGLLIPFHLISWNH